MQPAFPIEVWQMIFNHHGSESLKNLLAVSEKFRKMIIKSPELMRKLPVKFYGNDWKEIVSFVESHGTSVRAVEFNSATFSDIKKIADVLKITPKVEEIVFESCYFTTQDEGEKEAESEQEEEEVVHHDDGNENADDENRNEANENIENDINADVNNSDDEEFYDCEIDENMEAENNEPLNLVEQPLDNVEPPENVEPPQKEITKTENDDVEITLDLHNLSHITFHYSSSETIIELFKFCTTLKTLKYHEYRDEPNTSVLNFVAQQPNLETFDLKYPEFNETFLETCTFKLRTLNIQNETEFNRHISNFLLAQSKSIENLTLTVADFHYFRLISKNFHKLKYFKLDVNSFMNDSRLEEMKKLKIPSVIELDINIDGYDNIDLQAFIEVFPNVERLTIDISSSMRGILEKLPKLEKLFTSNFHIEMMMFTNSKSLKELEIESLQPVTESVFWEKFAENFPSIEILKIKNIEGKKLAACNVVETLMLSLKYFKNLKYCELLNEDLVSYYIIKDSDQTIDRQNQECVINVPQFQLILKRNSQSKLYISSYFNTVLVRARDTLIDDLEIQSTAIIEGF